MRVVVRNYSGPGAKEVFDVLEAKKDDVESVMRSVNGFVSYTLARTGDGGFSVTVCEDQAGIDESIQKAKDWIVKNVPDTGAAPPQVTDGAVILQLK